MQVKAGVLSNYTNSMAAAIEHAFMTAWPEIMNGQSAPEPNPQMRLLFIAVAQGVVSHLVHRSAIMGNATLPVTNEGILY